MSNIVFVGNGGLLQACINHLLSKNIVPTAVLTTDKEILSIAKQNRFEILKSIDDLYNRNEYIDYLISINNEIIFSEKFLKKIKKLAINYHNSLLPKYAGINSTAHAIKNQEKMHGISWHVITSEIDVGDILYQTPIPISKSDTTELLNIKCFFAALKSFKKLTSQFDNISGSQQNLALRSYYSFKDNYFSGDVYWTLPAKKIISYIKACQFGKEENLFGLAIIKLNKNIFVIHSAKIAPGLKATKPGHIKKVQDKLYVSAVDHYIEIKEIRDCYNEIVELAKIGPTQLERQSSINYRVLISKQTDRQLAKILSELNCFSVSKIQIPHAKKVIKKHNTVNPSHLLTEALIQLLKKNTPSKFFIFIKSSLFIPHKIHDSTRVLDYTTFEIRECEVVLFEKNPYKFINSKVLSSRHIDLLFFSRHQSLNVSAFLKGKADFIINSSSYILKETQQEAPCLHYTCKNSVAKEKDLITLSQVEVKDTRYKCNISAWMDHIFLKYAKKIAIQSSKGKFSFTELHNQVSFLAQSIIKQGVIKNCPILVASNDPVELIVGILAIIKAGGFYIPISTEYPNSRIKYIIKKTEALFFLTNKHFFSKRKHATKDLQFLNIENRVGTYDENFHFPLLNGNDIIYTVFTSGTTGDPKGVAIKHKNLSSLFCNTQSLFNFSKSDSWVLFHSYCFDFSVWEIFGALLYGGTLHVVDKNITLSPRKLIQYLVENEITVINQTPSYFYHISEPISEAIKNKSLNQLRLIIFGGEKLNFKSLTTLINAKEATGHKLQLINMYGITEATVHATFYEISSEDVSANKSIIGKFIPGTEGLLLDQNKSIVLPGSVGELYIYGPGISDGYLNDEIASQNQFISLKHLGKVGIYYKSGDMMRLRSDGNYEYINRIDNIKKIRGYRINTDEIKSLLLAHNKIKHAEVTTIEQKKQSILVAFYELKKDSEFTEKKLLFEYLKKSLPPYMIPNFLKEVNHFPVTENGKVDLSAMKESCLCENLKNNVYINSSIENQFLAICKKVLNTDDIELEYNFFQIGGDSITAMSLVYECTNILNWAIDITDIYKKKKLGEIFTLGVSNNNPSLKRKDVCEKSLLTCSSIEKAIWFSDISCLNNKFNVGFAILLPKNTKMKEITDLLYLTLYNINFPSSIHYKSGKLLKNDFIKNNIKLKNISHSKSSSYIREDFKSKIDLSVNTLQINILRSINSNRHLLYLKSHHAIMDGESLFTIVNIIKKFLKNSYSLSEGYSKYSTPIKDKKQEFDMARNQGIIKTIIHRAVTDNYLIIKNNVSSINKITISLSESLTNEIITVAKKLHASLPSIFATAFSLLIFKKYKSFPLIGFTINSRNSNNLDAIGSYSNLLPLFIKVINNMQIERPILQAHKDIGALLSIRDCPPGLILKELSSFSESVPASLFDFVFTYNDIRKSLLMNNLSNHIAILKPSIPKYLCNIEVNRLSNRFIVECWDGLGCFDNKTIFKEQITNAISETLRSNNAKIYQKANINNSKIKNKPLLEVTENHTHIYQTLYRVFCDYLNVKSFDKSVGFFELGITSLDLIELSSKIHHFLNMSVQPIDFLANPNFNSFYQNLLSNICKRETGYEK